MLSSAQLRSALLCRRTAPRTTSRTSSRDQNPSTSRHNPSTSRHNPSTSSAVAFTKRARARFRYIFGAAEAGVARHIVKSEMMEYRHLTRTRAPSICEHLPPSPTFLIQVRRQRRGAARRVTRAAPALLPSCYPAPLLFSASGRARTSCTPASTGRCRSLPRRAPPP